MRALTLESLFLRYIGIGILVSSSLWVSACLFASMSWRSARRQAEYEKAFFTVFEHPDRYYGPGFDQSLVKLARTARDQISASRPMGEILITMLNGSCDRDFVAKNFLAMRQIQTQAITDYSQTIISPPPPAYWWQWCLVSGWLITALGATAQLVYVSWRNREYLWEWPHRHWWENVVFWYLFVFLGPCAVAQYLFVHLMRAYRHGAMLWLTARTAIRLNRPMASLEPESKEEEVDMSKPKIIPSREQSERSVLDALGMSAYDLGHPPKISDNDPVYFVPEVRSARQSIIRSAAEWRDIFLHNAGTRRSALERDIDSTRSALQKAGEVLTQAQRRYAEAQIGLARFMGSLDQTRTQGSLAFLDELRRILAHDLIAAIKIDGTTLIEFTETIFINHENDLYEIGNFRLHLPLTSSKGGIRVHNIRNTHPRGVDHPFGQNGNFCSGDASGSIDDALKRREIAVATEILLRSLQSGKGSTHTPVTEWKKVPKGTAR